MQSHQEVNRGNDTLAGEAFFDHDLQASERHRLKIEHLSPDRRLEHRHIHQCVSQNGGWDSQFDSTAFMYEIDDSNNNFIHSFYFYLLPIQNFLSITLVLMLFASHFNLSILISFLLAIVNQR
jgi:hypothetical protein